MFGGFLASVGGPSLKILNVFSAFGFGLLTVTFSTVSYLICLIFYSCCPLGNLDFSSMLDTFFPSSLEAGFSSTSSLIFDNNFIFFRWLFGLNCSSSFYCMELSVKSGWLPISAFSKIIVFNLFSFFFMVSMGRVSSSEGFSSCCSELPCFRMADISELPDNFNKKGSSSCFRLLLD